MTPDRFADEFKKRSEKKNMKTSIAMPAFGERAVICFGDQTLYVSLNEFHIEQYPFEFPTCKMEFRVNSVRNEKTDGEDLCPGDIKNVIFNPPATIVFWADGTKTVVQARGEEFDPEKGLAMAISKKALGNQGNYYNQFKKWTEKYEPTPICHELKDHFRSFEEVMKFIKDLTDEWNRKLKGSDE